MTVQVVCAANGRPTPHDGEYVVAWNPHTPYGVCDITTTADKTKARRFVSTVEAFGEYNTISSKQPRRPTDGKPNRPLCGLSVMMEQA